MFILIGANLVCKIRLICLLQYATGLVFAKLLILFFSNDNFDSYAILLRLF